MIKKTVEYVDYNGVTRKEDHYFNLTEAEVFKAQFAEVGGLDKMLVRIAKEQDINALINLFTSIMKEGYGKLDPDGRRFRKGNENWLDFYESPAYSKLYMELISDGKKAADFIKGMLPENMATPEAIAAGREKLAAEGIDLPNEDAI